MGVVCCVMWFVVMRCCSVLSMVLSCSLALFAFGCCCVLLRVVCWMLFVVCCLVLSVGMCPPLLCVDDCC